MSIDDAYRIAEAIPWARCRVEWIGPRGPQRIFYVRVLMVVLNIKGLLRGDAK